ncbi:hypothetical protein ES319_A11G189400v1 [Gossypium barbadense]|uniref:Serine carboxypeptidase S28 family protein n=1 Tax=Gossypium barbadense TaxID=3634 RepID=A0A5J5TSH5_GOSBA|nr:hypothetical protein ES319_A11G189400v1 [Gossypium barbadense]
MGTMRLSKPLVVSVSLLFFVALSGFAHGFVMTPRSLLNRLSQSSYYLTTKELWFDQTLDHYSPYVILPFCFSDICYFYSKLYFLFIPKFLPFFFLAGPPVLAKKFGAAVVSLEHRYYGKSSPFKSHTMENLKYLSSKQALFDLAVFRQWYQESLNLKRNRTGAENAWFVFGVSYSGALSAWFRLKFPHLTCGSLASSAVVLAVYNYTDYDKQVGESAGPECKAVLQEITELVDRSLETNKKELKKQFGAAELDIDGDFFYFLADAAVVAFQYGHPDALCTPLVDTKKAGMDLVAAYAKYVKEYFVVLTGYGGFKYVLKLHISRWHPQMTPFALPKLIQYHLDLCKNVFGEGIYPEVDVTNIYYGGTNIAGSKIIFTNGSQDPWRHASKQTSSPGMPSYIITCHNCGHGIDMRECPQTVSSIEDNAQSCSIPDAVNKVRHKMTEHIDLWLSECKGSGWHSMYTCLA